MIAPLLKEEQAKNHNTELTLWSELLPDMKNSNWIIQHITKLQNIYTSIFYTCQHVTQMYTVVVSSTSQPSEMVLTNKVAGGVVTVGGDTKELML